MSSGGSEAARGLAVAPGVVDERLAYARVLTEIGWLVDAERLAVDVLDDCPESLDALSLYAKLKHMRGELSQAISCWAQIHARSPFNDPTIMQLGALMQMAQDPMHRAAEYVALGHQLTKKPAGQLALEEAFVLFQARKPVEARRVCEALARRYADKDRDTYKLAVLANAWLAELTGEIDEAIAVLEKLGRERDFATDRDRLNFLERLYRLSGTADRVEAAIKILRHFEQEAQDGGAASMSVLSRLAALYRRSARGDDAEEYAGRFLRAFRRRMHRPTYAELTAVASVHYVPLRELWRVQFVARDLPRDAPRRQRAVAAALDGHWLEAQRGFVRGGDVLDGKYLADVAAAEGNEDRAASLYLSAYREDPADIAVLGWLLDHVNRRGPRARAVVSLFEDETWFRRALDLLEERVRATPRRPSLWEFKAGLFCAVGDEKRRAESRARCEVLLEAASRKNHAVGRALSAGVYHFIGKAKGIIHELWADRVATEPGRGGQLDAEDVLGNVTAEMKQGIRNTFVSVREWARDKFPHLTADILDYDYTFKVPKEDEPSGGLSAGLPTALAFLSVFLQRPLPQHAASTGILVTESHRAMTVHPVGEIDFKVKAAYHRNLRIFIVPRGNLPALEGSDEVPPAIVEQIARPAATLEDAVRLVFGPNAFL